MKGLTSEEVKLRIQNNQVNYDNTIKTKSIMKIINENIFSIFNLLNFVLAFLVLSVNSYKNLLFIGIVICNTIISTIQAIRSKLIVDKLSIINTDKVNVIRDGSNYKIGINEIVLDDIISYKIGSQIITDAIILEGNVDVNESFITGESDLKNYSVNDILKSGSFVVSGNCLVRVTSVGEANYTSLITKDSKYIKNVNSILMHSLNKIIKLISILIIPIGLLLFYNQYTLNNDYTHAIINTVAALVGMIPEGLILLTSTVLAVSVIRLSKLNVLVRDLFCIENLARVDTICLDKTGTITTGNLEVVKVINISNYNIDEIMGNIVNALNNDNATMTALNNYFPKLNNYKVLKTIPFSPINKYSAVMFENGNYIIGAPEFISDINIKEVDENQSKYRVLLLGCIQNSKTEPIAVILIKDEIRLSAKKTLDYFKKQGVDIKIVSGDNINTLINIASTVSIDPKAIDVSNIDLTNEIIKNYNIFGRVSPTQKKEIVKMLQDNGHVVAMTGDGVNDVLALKQADCSITVTDATESARNVSQIILLDSSFEHVPKILQEGRRTINNIERSASLFLSKTGYAFLTALLFIFLNYNYPFEPIQLTLINFFTIGIPSFVLALEPNNERIKGKFLINVFSKSFPASITNLINIILVSIIGHIIDLSNLEISTMCVIISGFTGFLLLYRISLPFNKIRLSLFITLILGFIICIIGFKNLFSITNLKLQMIIILLVLNILSILIFNLVSKLINKYFKNK